MKYSPVFSIEILFWFYAERKIVFSSSNNKSDVNKTYIDISNGQKFELQIKKNMVAFSVKVNIVFSMRVFVRETDWKL